MVCRSIGSPSPDGTTFDNVSEPTFCEWTGCRIGHDSGVGPLVAYETLNYFVAVILTHSAAPEVIGVKIKET